jgi:2-keto-4-pentenoate hydratase/2-oxohepta-3-ene-1,7-dioic acid hydratase in catechol pathway
MKIARIKNETIGETYAIVSEDEKRLITKSEIQEQTGIPIPPRIKEFMFEGWLNEVKEHQGKLEYIHRIEDVGLLAPLPNPSKIICLAFNYYDHAKDAGLTPSDEPVIFMKPRTTLNPPFSDIISPSFVKRLDYEAEIAAIIGKDIKKVSVEHALDSIFGYKQFTRGKSIDTFAPCGPWITTKDEIEDPQNLKIITKVNGEIRQNSSSINMVIPIKKIISSLSMLMTIEAGDIISTGTPAGVAMSMKEPKYLKDDDIVEISIERLGRIRNRIVFQ